MTYIGSNPPFVVGQKVKIRNKYTLLIENLLIDKTISYNATYTFLGYDGYGFGSNYCQLKEPDISIPEHALELA